MNVEIVDRLAPLTRSIERQIKQNREALRQIENGEIKREARDSFKESTGRFPDDEFEF
jgi:hypothetical protein